MGKIGFLSDNNNGGVLVLVLVLDTEQSGMVRFMSVNELAEMDDIIVTFCIKQNFGN